jgi:hypothetical protein
MTYGKNRMMDTRPKKYGWCYNSLIWSRRDPIIFWTGSLQHSVKLVRALVLTRPNIHKSIFGNRGGGGALILTPLEYRTEINESSHLFAQGITMLIRLSLALCSSWSPTLVWLAPNPRERTQACWPCDLWAGRERTKNRDRATDLDQGRQSNCAFASLRASRSATCSTQLTPILSLTLAAGRVNIFFCHSWQQGENCTRLPLPDGP